MTPLRLARASDNLSLFHFSAPEKVQERVHAISFSEKHHCGMKSIPVEYSEVT